jgi:tRNA A-37 threonylcarbamoyl transferase component Bud32
MERAITPLVRWRNAGLTIENAMIVRRHLDKNGCTWKIYPFGHLGLDETLLQLPELLLDGRCETIKRENKISVLRLPLTIGHVTRFVYVKQYNALSFRHRLTSLFNISPALRALFGAAALLQEGYATALPIAAVEQRIRGVLIKSFYISEEVAGAKTVRDYWREDLRSLRDHAGRSKRRGMLRSLAFLFRSLHEKRIYHNDLKASNILALESAAETNGMIALIDLQGIKKCYFLSRRRRIKNLAQLNRTLGADLSRTEKLFFMQAYWGDQNDGRRERKQVVRTILKETSRQIVRESQRHPTVIHPSHQVASAPKERREKELRGLAAG